VSALRAQGLPGLSAVAVAVTVAGAALVATCLHLLGGLATSTSIIVAAVLGMLALLVLAAVVLFVLAIAALGRAINEGGEGPTPHVRPGNLPAASAGSDMQASEPDEAPEVWE
jgi:hypothetical protein